MDGKTDLVNITKFTLATNQLGDRVKLLLNNRLEHFGSLSLRWRVCSPQHTHTQHTGTSEKRRRGEERGEVRGRRRIR